MSDGAMIRLLGEEIKESSESLKEGLDNIAAALLIAVEAQLYGRGRTTIDNKYKEFKEMLRRGPD